MTGIRALAFSDHGFSPSFVIFRHYDVARSHLFHRCKNIPVVISVFGFLGKNLIEVVIEISRPRTFVFAEFFHILNKVLVMVRQRLFKNELTYNLIKNLLKE